MGTDLVGYVGSYVAFDIKYSMMTSQNDPRKNKLWCSLHGIAEEQGSFAEYENAKIKAQAIYDWWLDKMNITVFDDDEG